MGEEPRTGATLPLISAKKLVQFQQTTFTNLGKPTKTFEKAQEWVHRRGFVFFWPIKDFPFPSLWSAVAGNRPVTYEDPGNITWTWKDNSLGKKNWYYSKLIRRKSTIVSMDIAPFFYALTQNYGDPENDYLELYRQGLMSLAAKNIYEVLLKYGPQNTIDLRKEAGLSSKNADSEFNRAMEFLQIDMKILPVGISEAGAWKYSFIYQIVPFHLPEIPEKAREISEKQARRKLLSLFFNACGYAPLGYADRFFGWPKNVFHEVIDELVNENQIMLCHHNKANKEGYCLPEIIG